MSKQRRLCEDCIYFAPDLLNWSSNERQRKYARCTRTAKVTKESGNHCDQERTGNFLVSRFFGTCGEDGRFWEEKKDDPIGKPEVL